MCTNSSSNLLLHTTGVTFRQWDRQRYSRGPTASNGIYETFIRSADLNLELPMGRNDIDGGLDTRAQVRLRPPLLHHYDGGCALPCIPPQALPGR